MKTLNLLRIVCLFFIAGICDPLSAQTLLITEDFEIYGNGTTYRANQFDDGNNDVWSRSINSNNGPNNNTQSIYTGFQNTDWWCGEDMDATDNPLGAGSPGYLMLKTLDVSAYQYGSIEVKVYLAGNTASPYRYESSDYLKLKYAFNGNIATGADAIGTVPTQANLVTGTYTDFAAFYGSGSSIANASALIQDTDLDGTNEGSAGPADSLQNNFVEWTFSFPVGAADTALSVLFEALTSSGSEEVGIDHIRVFGIPGTPPCAHTSDTVQAGSSTLTSSANTITPYTNFFEDGRQQLLIHASEITAAGGCAGNLSGLGLEIASVVGVANNLNISLKQTTDTTFATFTFDNSGFSSVFSGTQTNIVGWNYYTFNTPFVWDGTSNIVVNWCFNNTSFVTNSAVYYSVTPFTSLRYSYTDGADGCTLASFGSNSNRPNIRLVYPALLVALSPTNPSCNGGVDGQVSVSPSNGTAPYSFVWSTGSLTNSISALSAGNYTVTVTDATGKTVASSTVLSNPASIVPGLVATDILCNGSTLGSISATPSNGTSPYTYLWSTGATSSSISGLAIGTYHVTVSDAIGCSAVDSASISQASSLIAFANVSSSINCNGFITGEVTATQSAGTSPFSYQWNTGGINATEPSLVAGTYSVTITDADGCTDSASVELTEPSAMLVSATVNSAIDCNGFSTGEVMALSSGGTTPYTYGWNTGATAALEVALGVGTYSVTVTDANGCTDSTSVVLTEPSALIASAIVSFPIPCHGYQNGRSIGSQTGGIAPYTYNWNTGGVNALETGLSVGTYSVTVTDANGCTDSASVVLNQPAALLAAASITSPIICNGFTTGEATVAQIGGVAPFTYSWNTGGTLATESSLGAGTYSVTITDANGCTDSASVLLNQPAALLASASVSLPINCNGFFTGEATAAQSGGVAPFTYIWNTGGTLFTESSLGAGTYSVTITDANGCTDSASAVLSSPAAMTVSLSPTDASAPGANDGSIAVGVTNGVPVYSYSWSNGSTGNPLTSVVAGTYTVTVTDANGCTATSTDTVQAQNGFGVSIATSSPTCIGGSDGTATASTANGIAPFTYSWSTGANTATVTGLASGTYSVTVTDSAGATASTFVQLNDPTFSLSLAATAVGTSNLIANDGSINLTVTGGSSVPSRVGALAPSSPGNSLGNVNAGMTFNVQSFVYLDSITVYANGYQTIELELYNSNDSLLMTKSIIVPGSGKRQVHVGFPIPPGTGYKLIRGTFSSGGLGDGYPNFPYPLTDTTGALTITYTNSSGILRYYAFFFDWVLTVPDQAYQWSNGAQTEDIDFLLGGTYTVTVSDSVSCVQKTVVVPTGNGLYFSSNNTNLNCFGDGNGSIDLSVFGGTAPFTYAWSTGASTQDISALSNGTYTVTVSDSVGNVEVFQTSITEPAGAVEATLSPTHLDCQNDLGELTLGVTGGTGPFTYSVNGGAAQNLSGIQANWDQIQAGTSGYWIPKDLAIDAQGSVFITGQFRGTMEIDGQSFSTVSGPSQYHYDFFIAKLDSEYNLQWFRSGGSPSDDYGFEIDLDGAGNAYVIGQFKDTFAIDTHTFVAAVSEDAFIAKYSTNGDLDWIRVVDGTGASRGNSIATDNAGNSYITGLFRATANFGSIALTASGYSKFYLAKYDANGVVQWAEQGGGFNYGDCNRVAIDPSGNIVIVPIFNSYGTNRYGSTILNAVRGRSAIITVTPAGAFLSSTTFDVGTNSSVTPYGISFDASGDIYVTGSFTGTIVVGNSSHLSHGGGDMFIARFGSNGVGKWASYAGNKETFLPDVGTDIVTDAAGNSYVSGQIYEGTGTFETSPTPILFTSSGQMDNFVVKYNSIGNVIWIKQAVGGGNSDGDGLWVEDGKVHLCGAYAGTISFDNTSYTTNSYSGFLARIDVALNDTLDSLAAGTYSIQVTDANGCTALSSTTIFDLDSFQIVSSGQDVSCAGNTDGYATAQGATGVLPYTFIWNTGDTTDTVFGLGTGTYYVTVSDGSGCAKTDSVVVGAPAVILVSLTSTAASTAGASDGSSNASVTNGSPVFTFNWSNGSTGNPLTGVPAGTYSLTVTDGNGCTAIASDSVSDGPAEPVTQLYSSFCGDTVANLNVWMGYNSLSGATNYRYLITAPGFSTVYTRGYGATNFRFSQVPGVTFNTTYQVSIAGYVNGAWGNYGPACAVSTPANLPTPNLLPAYCGITLNSLSDWMYITTIPGADNYRYEVTAPGFSHVYTRGYQWTSFRLDLVPGIQINTTYTVRVAASINGVWGAYGSPCTVASPASVPTTQLVTSSCNITVSALNEYLYVNTVPGADNYRYEVTAPGFSYVLTRGWNAANFLLSQVPGINFNTTYSIRAAASINGLWGNYGTACNVTTPSTTPTTQLVPSNCDITLSTWTNYLFYQTVPGASRYRLEVTAPGFSTVYVRPTPSNLFRMDWIAGLQASTTYTVRVAAEVGGSWGPYGSSCTLTTPNTPARIGFFDQEEPVTETSSENALLVYPNPNQGEFFITGSWKDQESVEVQLYDLKGALLLSWKFPATTEGQPLRIETTLSAGTYLLRTQSGDGIDYQKVIVH